MKNTTPIISVRGLKASYGETEILRNIDLDIFPHQVTVILGGSGSGKTTLLKNILRLEEPREGSVRYWGTEVLGMDDHSFEQYLRRIGVLFQGGALINSLSVLDNIAIPLEQHTKLSRSAISRIIRVKLKLVRLTGVTHLLPGELSGGMQKRVALARAMALDPELLFCDEPTAGLDPQTSAALDALLLDLKNLLKMSIVIVTHDLATINRVADRVVFIDSGTILFQGSLAEAKAARIKAVDDFFLSGRYD